MKGERKLHALMKRAEVNQAEYTEIRQELRALLRGTDGWFPFFEKARPRFLYKLRNFPGDLTSHGIYNAIKTALELQKRKCTKGE